MTKYRHREKGYEVNVIHEGPDERSWIIGYRHTGSDHNIYLATEDFNKLFESVKEYCCDWFRMCVERGIIEKYRDDPDEHVWVWYELDESFTECPFCGAKL